MSKIQDENIENIFKKIQNFETLIKISKYEDENKESMFETIIKISKMSKIRQKTFNMSERFIKIAKHIDENVGKVYNKINHIKNVWNKY